MKKIIPNLIMMALGVISILLVSIFTINGVLGCGITTTGIILIIAGIVYKANNPIKVLIDRVMNLF